jgi:hypothetical protein
VLTLTGDRLHGITRFLDDRLLHHFERSLAGQASNCADSTSVRSG